MAKRTIVTLVCDVCGVEREDVVNHILRIDRKRPLEVDACAKDWEKAPLSKLMKAARLIRKGQSLAHS